MITAKHYTNLDNAFRYFNEKLFENKLPDAIITMNRKKGTKGYFSFQKFSYRDRKESVSEISLNPDEFLERTDIEILSTLAHEMCHLWQYCFADPARKGYHDKVFARKMYEIGLQTSSTGEPDGKPTGQRMTHYIIRGGKFEKVAQGFLLSNDKLLLESLKEEEKEKKERKKNRYKFVCPDCGMAAWAAGSAKLACGDCKTLLEKEEDNDND